mmetsp:Transcript_4615/g.12226  ORF Transcript_4615/g.12226 Transcript_4615/m.12226 type:complete len:100 (+) Transcript_4615:97-396(+)|eukprot:1126612-Prymnesium_polylepis.1
MAEKAATADTHNEEELQVLEDAPPPSSDEDEVPDRDAQDALKSPDVTWSASGGVRGASFRKRLHDDVAKMNVAENASSGNFVRATKKHTSALDSIASGS